MTPQPRGLLLYLLTVVFCCAGLVAVPTACSGSQRQKTLKTTIAGLNAARDGFTEFDRGHQLSIVEKATTREGGEKQLTEYRAQRTPIVDAFELTYRLLAVAATQDDDPSLREALDASMELLTSIKKLMGGK